MSFGQCDPQKALPCTKPRCLSHQPRKSVQRFGLGAITRNKKWIHTYIHLYIKNAHFAYISPQRGGGRMSHPISTKFGVLVDLDDVINCAKYHRDRVRGFCVVKGWKWAFPLYQPTHPYHFALHYRACKWCSANNRTGELCVNCPVLFSTVNEYYMSALHEIQWTGY